MCHHLGKVSDMLYVNLLVAQIAGEANLPHTRHLSLGDLKCPHQRNLEQLNY